MFEVRPQEQRGDRPMYHLDLTFVAASCGLHPDSRES